MTNTKHFRWCNVYNDVCTCTIGRSLIIRVLFWRKSVHLLAKIYAKNDFYMFIPSDLDLWPLDLKLAPIVTLVLRYVFHKLKISTAFLFLENQRHGPDGRTDGVQHLMQSPERAA